MTVGKFSFPTAVSAVVLLLSVIPGGASAQGPGGLYGGTLIVGTTSVLDPSPLNLSPENAVLHSLLYDALAIPSSTTLVPEPWLATSWDVNLSASSVAFHIRGTAKFSDGSALTADAVVASFQRYATAGFVSGFSVVALDPTTAVFTFTGGGGDFLGKWVALPIAYATSTGPAKTSGLFTLGTSVPGVSLTITANANHWQGRPYLDAIRYEFHTGPTGMDEIACQLIEHHPTQPIDFIAVPLTPNDLTADRPCANGRGRLQEAGNESLSHIFTAADPGFSFLHLGLNTQHAPLNDSAFRVAVTSALDRDLITDIEPGSEIADSVVTPANAFWFNASVPQYRVAKGVEGGRVVTILDNVNDMLDRAGYFDRDGDGWRDTPTGAPFVLTFPHVNATTDPRYAKIDGIVLNLNTVGIHLNETLLSPSEILARVQADDFDLYLGTYDVEADPSFLFDLFSSTRLTGRNYNNVQDAGLDAMLTTLRNALDLDARQRTARDIQGWVGESAVDAPLVHYETNFVYNRDRFEGWVAEPGGIDNLWSFAALHAIPRGALVVTLTPFTNSVVSGGTTTVIVSVTDADGIAVEDADIALSGGGVFTPATGTTDQNGRFQSTFAAPTVSVTQDTMITADVTKPGYDAVSGAVAITVRVIPQRLSVTVERSKAVLEAGQSTAVIVTVLDSTSLPLAGASVSLDLIPAGIGGTLSAVSGTTAANGTFTATLTASVGADTTFRITATASATGSESATASTSVLAKQRGGPPSPVGSVPGLDTISMVIVVAAAAFVFARWQTRRRKP